MRVLHICPLWFPIAVDSPGGIETFLAQLLPALQETGCDVSFLASGDSSTGATLIPAVREHLRLGMANGSVSEYGFYEQHQLGMAMQHAVEYDVVHSHIGFAAYSLSAMANGNGRILHTVHSPVYHDFEWYVSNHPEIWISTVSEFQARIARKAGAKSVSMIHNGIDFRRFDFCSRTGDGLAFMGRIEPGKGPDTAIQVARALDLPLTLAGPVVDSAFFAGRIKPFLGNRVQYVGELKHEAKKQLLGSSSCLLMPSRWAEPFGLVTIEAMACGTPVVALGSGALPEIVEDGITGYVGNDADAMQRLVGKAIDLDRAGVRSRAKSRFDIPIVASQYQALYAEMQRGMNGKGAPGVEQ